MDEIRGAGALPKSRMLTLGPGGVETARGESISLYQLKTILNHYNYFESLFFVLFLRRVMARL